MSRNLLRIASLAAALGAVALLSACDEMGEALGMERTNVADGAPVPTNPTLALPPDFALKPPRETPKDADPDSSAHPGPTDPGILTGK